MNNAIDPAQTLTKAALRSLHFAHELSQFHYSWSPKRAFDERENICVGHDGVYGTLQTYLSGDAHQRKDAATMLLAVPLSRLPPVDSPMRVYRAVDEECGALYGAVLPGACVTESRAYALRHGELHHGVHGSSVVLETDVFPDELVTFGDPHEFIYVPRSLELAYERYLRDLARHAAAKHVA